MSDIANCPMPGCGRKCYSFEVRQRWFARKVSAPIPLGYKVHCPVCGYTIASVHSEEDAINLHNRLCEMVEKGKLWEEHIENPATAKPLCPVCRDPLEEIRPGLCQCAHNGGRGYKEIVQLGERVEKLLENPPLKSIPKYYEPLAVGSDDMRKSYNEGVRACVSILKGGE